MWTALWGESCGNRDENARGTRRRAKDDRALDRCPHYTKLRARLWAQLDKYDVETDYDKIVSHPQATRYVVNFMHRTGLLQQFQFVGLEDDDDDDEQPTGQRATEAGVEDDGY